MLLCLSTSLIWLNNTCDFTEWLLVSSEMQRTILFSALMATLAVVPMGCFIGFDVYTWRRLLIEFRFEGFADRLYGYLLTML